MLETAKTEGENNKTTHDQQTNPTAPIRGFFFSSEFLTMN